MIVHVIQPNKESLQVTVVIYIEGNVGMHRPRFYFSLDVIMKLQERRYIMQIYQKSLGGCLLTSSVKQRSVGSKCRTQRQVK